MNAIQAMHPNDLEAVDAFAQLIAQQPQTPIRIEHDIHAGVYSRTAYIPSGVLVAGAVIRIPTSLVITGEVDVFVGRESFRVYGFARLDAEAGRKQIFHALTDTTITMYFATNARTVEEAENEFTCEAHNLQTRKAATCQE